MSAASSPAALLPIQLSAGTHRKSEEDDPHAWPPVSMWKAQMKCLIPDQPGPPLNIVSIWGVNQGMENLSIYPPPIASLCV